jgi:SAM-dependent methyltransferase
MHQSSLENMQRCYEKFVKTRSWVDRERINVVDIGGANVNGSYADIFSGSEFFYQAVDISPNENVDIVLDDPYQLPLAEDSVDIIISGQAFEHVEFFWLLFEEMIRVLKPDGLVILIAPSAGAIHRYPVDCYRFYPDAYHALAKYCKCEVVEVFHDNRGPWNDLVGVFSKTPVSFNDLGVDGRAWQLNRFEQDTRPVSTTIRNEDSSIEKIAGESAYIDCLAQLHEIIQPDLYFEIGVRKGKSLSLAKAGSIGVDPEPDISDELKEKHRVYNQTSDYFFEVNAKKVLENDKIDFAFIDGMHLFEYALCDFINIEKFSSEKTVVVIDDVFPNHVVQADRVRKSAVWMGDIWKLGYCLKKWRSDLQLTYLDTSPSGLLVITGLKAKNHTLTERYNPIVREYKEMLLTGTFAEEVVNRTQAVSFKDDKNLDKIRLVVGRR